MSAQDVEEVFLQDIGDHGSLQLPLLSVNFCAFLRKIMEDFFYYFFLHDLGFTVFLFFGWHQILESSVYLIILLIEGWSGGDGFMPLLEALV